MSKLLSIQEAKSQLAKNGIEICLSRKIGCNSFKLVSESYGHYTVNAVAGTSHEAAKRLEKMFCNITILIDN